MTDIKPVKLGILGEIRSGKDTVSNLLNDQLLEINKNHYVQYLAFSTGIHKVIELLFPHAYANGKPRKYLQDIGQYMRKVEQDVWIDYLFKSIPYEIAETYNLHMIVTDVRQPNEAKRLQEEGFKIIKVVADPKVRAERAKKAGDNFNPDAFTHETEISVHQCEYDYLIDNSSTLQDLEQEVAYVLKEVVEYEK